MSVSTIKIRIDNAFLDKMGRWLVFALLLLSTLGVVLPPPLKQLVGFLAYPAVLLLLLHRWKQILYTLTRDFSYLLLLLIAIASITWSAVPEMTIPMVRSLMSTTILVAYISSSYSPREQMNLWSRIFLIWGILSYVVEILFPGYTRFAMGVGGQDFWQGIFSFKLGLGTATALGGTLAIYAILRSKGKTWLPIVCLLGALPLLYLSRSTTSLVAFISVGLLFPIYIFSQQRDYKLRTVKFLLILLFSLAVVSFIIVNYETILVDWLGKDPTLTGRSTLWDAVIRQGFKRPWLGFGHGAFWSTEYGLDAAFENQWPRLPASGTYLDDMHSHNGYIDLFVSFGFLGLSALALNYFFLCKRILSLFFVLRKAEYFWMLQIVVFVSFVNYTEVGTFLLARNLLWILYSTTVLSSALESEKYKFRLANQSVVRQPNAFAALE